MSKDFIVVFTKTNARVLVNPPEMGMMLRDNTAVLNPDLKHVHKVPPHFWKMEYGVVAPMSKEERDARIKQITETGVDNTVITAAVVGSDPYPNLKGEIDRLVAEIEGLKSDIQNKNEENSSLQTKHDAIEHMLRSSDDMSSVQSEMLEDKMKTILGLSVHIKKCHAGLLILFILWIVQIFVSVIR